MQVFIQMFNSQDSSADSFQRNGCGEAKWIQERRWERPGGPSKVKKLEAPEEPDEENICRTMKVTFHPMTEDISEEEQFCGAGSQDHVWIFPVDLADIVMWSPGRRGAAIWNRTSRFAGGMNSSDPEWKTWNDDWQKSSDAFEDLAPTNGINED
ncbi:hypothetical protein OJAV_G00083920 [Oryzias javanicus]|uniref:Uncharacterized protein n=1 Tax=Oryzias javanicus TaxID=123683 RepID=A0A437D5A9_ORYJA|nr:hypothetical protein OJAV_G00083920 [Oryzias javanicus]